MVLCLVVDENFRTVTELSQNVYKSSNAPAFVFLYVLPAIRGSRNRSCLPVEKFFFFVWFLRYLMWERERAMEACRFSPIEGKIAPALPKEIRRGKEKVRTWLELCSALRSEGKQEHGLCSWCVEHCRQMKTWMKGLLSLSNEGALLKRPWPRAICVGWNQLPKKCDYRDAATGMLAKQSLLVSPTMLLRFQQMAIMIFFWRVWCYSCPPPLHQ